MIERAARALLRHYPLLSGCGALSTSSLGRLLVPPTQREAWADVAGFPCLVPLDDLVGRSAYLFGDLDPKVTWAVQRCLEPGDIAVDVGANLGVVSLQMAGSVGPAGRVIAFEPAPPTLRFLHSTLAANAKLPIRLLELAVGAADAELTLRIPRGNAGRATLSDIAPGEVAAEHRVQVRRLADILPTETEGKPIALMKMDIEGHEAEALRGLFEADRPVRPYVILFEGNSASTVVVLTLLKAEGYRVFGIPKRSYLSVSLVKQGAPGFMQSHDFVALHQDARPDTSRRLGIRPNF